MSVQNKVISLIFVVFLFYAALDNEVQHLLILPRFNILEQEEALRNMDRVVEAIEREIRLLGTTAKDWGSWDDTYRFMMDRNSAYRSANLKPSSLENLKFNMLYMFDAKNQPVWGLVYDLDNRIKLKLPELSGKLAASPLAAPDFKGEGYLLTSVGPLLVSGNPIMTTEDTGPSRGTIIFGKFLSTAAITSQTKTSLTITDLTAAGTAPEKMAAAAELRRQGMKASIVSNNSDFNRVYRLLPDIFGEPVLLLQVDVPRAISAKGKQAVDFALMSIFVAGALVLTVLFYGLRWIVLNPLAMLTRHTVSISQSNDLSQRVELKRKDELGKLAQELNQMVARLQEANNTLAAQSYSSGVAEMAKGVLHNIGNALTPLNVKLSTLKKSFQRAPIADLEMAAEELADPATPEDRRTDLHEVMELAGKELSALAKQAIVDLGQIHNQVDHVQQILVDQQRFSRAQRVMQALDISAVVKETVDFLSDTVRKSIAIDLDPSLERIGKVQAARIALQQVISNLLINSAESIFVCGKHDKTGRIRIYGIEEDVDGIPMVHLYFEDNGCGIPEEKLTKIFERGFTTKKRGSGLGLHWSTNTIASLKGRVYAENIGEGQGAVFHLLLPLARTDNGRSEGAL